jgi:hypothetical protein
MTARGDAKLSREDTSYLHVKYDATARLVGLEAPAHHAVGYVAVRNLI